MKIQEHYKIVSKLKKRMLSDRKVWFGKVLDAKRRAESLKTPKGRFFLALSNAILEMDKILNRKLWKDYH